MADDLVLVTGATGKLGRIVTRRLIEEGRRVRVFARRPAVASSLFGAAVEIAAGDFADAESLRAAVDGVDRLLLLSPIDEHLTRDQIAVVDAAEAASVGRIVKISGSDWTYGPNGTFSGAAHRQIEERLERSSIPFAALRPNAWMQVSLPAIVNQALTQRQIHAAHGSAKVSYIDARDIADVAVERLLAPQLTRDVLVLSGGEALGVTDLAAIASELLGYPVGVSDTPAANPARDGHINPFESQIIKQFITLLKAGKAESTSNTVPRLLGRPARTVREYLAEAFAAQAAAA